MGTSWEPPVPGVGVPAAKTLLAWDLLSLSAWAWDLFGAKARCSQGADLETKTRVHGSLGQGLTQETIGEE